MDIDAAGAFALGNIFGNMVTAAVNAALLAELHTVLNVCQLLVAHAHCNALITGQSLGSLDDLRGLSTEDARGLVKNYIDNQQHLVLARAVKLRFIQEKNIKIKSLIWWLHDKDQRQLTLAPAEWTACN